MFNVIKELKVENVAIATSLNTYATFNSWKLIEKSKKYENDSFKLNLINSNWINQFSFECGYYRPEVDVLSVRFLQQEKRNERKDSLWKISKLFMQIW